MNDRVATPRQERIAVPEPVTAADVFLNRLGIWHVLSENENGREASSCKDAADMRTRVGEPGIPLWDEMKTFMGRIDRAGTETYVMVHCRGDRQLDFNAIESVLGLSPQRLDEEELERLGMSYGLVNPFQNLTASVTHIFDRELLTPIGIPGTVMTNAGHRSWGVELNAGDLLKKLPNALEAEISVVNPDEGSRPLWATHSQHIGIITGNSSESGTFLLQQVNREIRKGLGRYAVGDTVMPEYTLKSLPQLGLTMQLNERHAAVRPHLLHAVRMLCEGGVNLVSIACNTTPYFSDDIRDVTAEYGADFVSMPEEVGRVLRARETDSIEFVAAEPVAKLDEWSAYREPLHGMDIRIPSSELIDDINDLAYEVKANGATQRGLNKLGNIIHGFESGTTVLFALTEMSLLLALRKPNHKSRVEVVDAMDIYAQSIARLYLGKDNIKTAHL